MEVGMVGPGRMARTWSGEHPLRRRRNQRGREGLKRGYCLMIGGTVPAERVVVMIATPLEAELVALIKAVDDRLEVRYQPELLYPRCASPATIAGSSRFTGPRNRNNNGARCWPRPKCCSVCPRTPRRDWPTP
ncbi:MAG: hypothetical protein ACRDQU_02100 [Pseudonocardiaceae bacterium]